VEVGDSAALNMDAVNKELERQRGLLSERNKCEGDGCKTLLNQYTEGTLCSVCRRKTKKQPETLEAFNARRASVCRKRKKKPAAVAA
jgi:hypothetical protein